MTQLPASQPYLELARQIQAALCSLFRTATSSCRAEIEFYSFHRGTDTFLQVRSIRFERECRFQLLGGLFGLSGGRITHAKMVMDGREIGHLRCGGLQRRYRILEFALAVLSPTERILELRHIRILESIGQGKRTIETCLVGAIIDEQTDQIVDRHQGIGLILQNGFVLRDRCILIALGNLQSRIREAEIKSVGISFRAACRTSPQRSNSSDEYRAPPTRDIRPDLSAAAQSPA